MFFLLIQLGEIKLLQILWYRDSSYKNLLETLASCLWEELDFPKLPLILLSAEDNNLPVLLFNQAHLEGLHLRQSILGALLNVGQI